MTSYETLKEKLKAYKNKYYLNQLIRGSILSISGLITFFLIFTSLEFALRFSSVFRAILFFSYLGVLFFVLGKWVINPLLGLIINKRQISDEKAAIQIGTFFPEISDKLLNTLQLQKNSDSANALIKASIDQKTSQITVIPFTKAINIKDNRKYLKYVLIPLSVVLGLLFIIPQLLTESTARIINFNRTYLPKMPFRFVLLNKVLKAFKNEDYTVKLKFEGNATPDNAYFVSEGRRIKMQKSSTGEYEFTIPKIQNSLDFNFEAAGFYSEEYELEVLERPELKDFKVNLIYPSYIRKENQELSNIGNFEVPEGTRVQWSFNTVEADSIRIGFENEKNIITLKDPDNQEFTFEKIINNPEKYNLKLLNKYSASKENIKYQINVIPDQHPQINLERIQDTTLFSFLVVGGNISDDYGLSALKIFYRNGQDKEFKSRTIPITKNQLNQSFYYQLDIDSLNIKQGSNLEYYLQVWDNDGIRGAKSSKTGIFTFQLPNKEQINESLATSSQNTQKEINKSVNSANELQKQIKDTENRIKGKKNLTWQDKKAIEDLIQKKDELNKEIEKMREQNQINSMKQEKFNEQTNELKEKVEQLQKLMDELLDDETKKLYDELNKLLEDQKDANQIQELLDKIEKKEENLAKELDRTLELFKRLKFDLKVQQLANDLKELSEEQNNLSKQTLDKKEEKEELSKKQEELNKEFENTQEDLKELEKLNEDLENENNLENNEQLEKEISEQQKQSKEQIEQNKRKQASQSQKNASQKMNSLSQKLKDMQNSMEMEMLSENLQSLRQIEDNLVKLSFDQETVMKEFREINQSDPRYIDLSQQQLKLKDDAKIIEDSLQALAKRVFQIQSFVTREVGAMNDYLDESLKSLKDRRQAQAIGKQQFAMTSINNLALLLDDILRQMQQQMADAMGNPQKGKKGSKKNVPGLGQLQKELNQKIEELKKSGKSGRGLSEELAKLAAEQEKIRQSMKDMQEKGMNGEGGENSKKLNEISRKMEQTEMDLVNKNLTQQTIQRQQDILTRLLEAENSMREREQDKKREAEKAKEHTRNIPPAFEEYIKAKEKEIELLKSIPPKLNTYYKKEVNNYFKRIENKKE